MTPSIEFHLFGNTSPGMDGIVVQHPLPAQSYSWSDFPIVFQEDSEMISQAPTPKFFSSQTLLPDSSSLSQRNREACKTPVIEAGSNSPAAIPAAPSKKNVRFTPFPKVRIYSLVLGNHPHCDDGLAIELGWDYFDSESHHNLSSSSSENIKHNRHAMYTGNTTKISCSKMPYLLRKQLLLDVAGCTKEELDQRIRAIETRPYSKKRVRSDQEDYFYRLAFAKRW